MCFNLCRSVCNMCTTSQRKYLGKEVIHAVWCFRSGYCDELGQSLSIWSFFSKPPIRRVVSYSPFDLLFMTIGIDGDECCCLVDYINNADLAALPRAFKRFLRSRLLNSRQNLLATISCESGYLSMINIFHYATSFTPYSFCVVYFLLFSLLSKFFCTHLKLLS